MASKCASKTLFVGNLHASLEENDLLEIFKPFGRIVECCKRWCHYGFIQFATEEEAKLAFNNLNGSKVRGRPMRIEFQRKKLRNIQALLEAEAESKLNFHSNAAEMSSNFFSNSDENFNPSINEEEIEKCFLKIFDEILVDDCKKSENDILKPIDNMKNIQNRKNSELKILENICLNSISSSCSSPLSQKDDLSPKTNRNSASVRLFRSLNSSNTIYVQPTDIIIPLSEGDYTEYKLFPVASQKQETERIQNFNDENSSVMNKILNNLGVYLGESSNEDLELYSPPISSVSSVSPCSISSSLASSPGLCNKNFNF